MNKPSVIELGFPKDQYFQQSNKKKQIVLHHTASGRGITGDFRHWINDPKRIATAFIIDFEGVIYQLFDDAHWGHHLGIKNSFDNVPLNKASIGIELDAWGGLKERDGKYYAWPRNWNQEVPADRVVSYAEPYRGFTHFERYTNAQLAAAEQLIYWLCEKHNIDRYVSSEVHDVTREALSGKSGVWLHSSFRADKNDLPPQQELTDMFARINAHS